MKSKLIALFIMPLAFSVLFTVNAQAKTHKIRMKMTGCLETTGTVPNTFVLNNITKGYTRYNQTGEAPLALARTEDFVLVPQGDVDLQKHLGQRVKISGWISDEPVATSSYGTVIAPSNSGATVVVPDNSGATVVVPQGSSTAVIPSNTVATASVFRVTHIHKLSGSCIK
jgi:hypothetical protein